jgi:histidine-containing phosphotransfer protein
MADAVAAHQQQLLESMQVEGLLDEQFQQLLALQDESNPDFVTEVAELYFDDAVPKITRVGQLLSAPAPDFGELDAVVHQFKGSSASLGAGGMAKLCIRMRELCQQRDVAGCQALVMQVHGGGGGAAGTWRSVSHARHAKRRHGSNMANIPSRCTWYCRPGRHGH